MFISIVKKKVDRQHTEVTLTHGVSLRTNLNIDSTKLAGVDSSHFSSDRTTQICNLSMSLKITEYFEYGIPNRYISMFIHTCIE